VGSLCHFQLQTTVPFVVFFQYGILNKNPDVAFVLGKTGSMKNGQKVVSMSFQGFYFFCFARMIVFERQPLKWRYNFWKTPAGGRTRYLR
jgi:hypothetical protein